MLCLPLAGTATSLDLLDAIKTKYPNEIVRADTTTFFRMSDIFLSAGVTVGDRLRETFMCGEDAMYPDVFTVEVKKEFLYHCMWRLCAGGAICQYEDDYEVYMHTARDVYKDLVNVRRAAEGSSVDVETATEVFMVTELVD